MRRIGVMLVGVALALPACGVSTETGRPTGPGNTASEPDARTVAVYAAVIRQLVTEGHTFGDDESPFERVFVDVRIYDRAGAPDASDASPPGIRLPAADRAAILRELADLAPVEFVEDRDSVIVDEDACARVKGNGVLITLGPISGGERKVTVPNSLFFACLGGQWLTYVLERGDADWQVVGTKGPIAIS